MVVGVVARIGASIGLGLGEVLTGSPGMKASLDGQPPTASASVRSRQSLDPKIRERDLAVRLSQATIADAIGLLLRSERHRQHSLADLEWLLLPPLLLKQIMFSYVRPQIAKNGGIQTLSADEVETIVGLPPMAIAMVTWAIVSPEVNAKLDAQLRAGNSCRLAPHEWKCGEIPRLIEALGQPAAVQATLAKLAAKIPQLVVRNS